MKDQRVRDSFEQVTHGEQPDRVWYWPIAKCVCTRKRFADAQLRRDFANSEYLYGFGEHAVSGAGIHGNDIVSALAPMSVRYDSYSYTPAHAQVVRARAYSCRTFHATSAGAQTAAGVNAQMNLVTRAQISSQRVGDAMEIYMYIGGGALLIIILLVIFLR